MECMNPVGGVEPGLNCCSGGQIPASDMCVFLMVNEAAACDGTFQVEAEIMLYYNHTLCI